MFALRMKFSATISFVILVFFSSIIAVTGPGCANIIPPSGGFKDSLPPMLRKVSPPDSSRNFKETKITLTFDEFVEVQGIQENLLVSPTPKIAPIVESKLNTVTVKIKDTLEANTTYSFNFGNAIKDINEGNVAKNFTYLFSTGPNIDSFELSGKVVLAESGQIDTTLILMLHRSSDDSAVAKERPRYVAKQTGKGNFTFRNLPAGTYYLYALKSEGGSFNYQPPDQYFAFYNEPVIVTDSVKPVSLFAYKEKEERESKAAGGNNRGATTPADKKLKIDPVLENGMQDLQNDFVINFTTPLKFFDSSKIKFSSDSFTAITKYRVVKDTGNKKISLVYPWKENTKYNLILDKEFASDTAGRQLVKTDTLGFKTKKLSEYGSLNLRLKKIDLTKNPVVLFYLNDKLVKSAPLTSETISFKLFLPGEYELRILADNNKNGKWDTGEFFGKHRQPELVTPVTRRIIVKANWDNEFEIVL
jgi:Bacterial Ig-like domain